MALGPTAPAAGGRKVKFGGITNGGLLTTVNSSGERFDRPS